MSTASEGGKNPAEAIGSWLAVLVAGIVGAFSFLGLEQDEVAVILRRTYWEPSLVALLIAMAIIVSIVSLFTSGKRIRVLAGLSGIALVLSTVPFTIRAIPGPASTSGSAGRTFALGILLVVLAVGLFIADLRRGASLGRYVSLQAVTLIVAVCFAASAIYSAMRLVTRSQYETTNPQVDATVTTGGAPKLELKVRASKLGRFDDVSVTVLGVPRGGKAGTSQQPCSSPRQCDFVAGAILPPDEFGKVAGSFAVPIDALRHEHLSVKTLVCIIRASGRCKSERVTTLDVRLPQPIPTTTTSKP